MRKATERARRASIAIEWEECAARHPSVVTVGGVHVRPCIAPLGDARDVADAHGARRLRIEHGEEMQRLRGGDDAEVARSERAVQLRGEETGDARRADKSVREYGTATFAIQPCREQEPSGEPQSDG